MCYGGGAARLKCFRAVPFNMLWEGRVTKPKKDGGSGVVKKIFSKMETGEGSKFRDFKHGCMEKTTGGDWGLRATVSKNRETGDYPPLKPL